MPIWFWGWLAAGVIMAVIAAITRDTLVAPWAAGAFVAAGLSAAGVAPLWHWIGFLATSAVLFVALNRKRYIGKHRRARSRTRGDHEPRATR